MRIAASTWPDFTADYSLDVENGTLCAVVGPSGGGKTTLLHMIAGFETPASGELSFDEARPADRFRPPSGPSRSCSRTTICFPHLSARENASLGLRPVLAPDPEERAARCRDDGGGRTVEGLASASPARCPAASVSVWHWRGRSSHGGPLILLDEPFSNLDPGLRRDMILLVDQMRQSGLSRS